MRRRTAPSAIPEKAWRDPGTLGVSQWGGTMLGVLERDGEWVGYKRKLIEVALPLDAINRECARDSRLGQGHPRTLHLWWARLPVAAARAVLWASLVDDPSAHSDRFPTDEEQAAERRRLFGILERLVVWENSSDPEVLAEAQGRDQGVVRW